MSEYFKKIKNHKRINMTNRDLIQQADPNCLSKNQFERSEFCCNIWDNLELSMIENNEIKLIDKTKNHCQCGMWFCPNCANARASNWYFQLLPIMKRCESEKKYCYFITFTIPNPTIDQCLNNDVYALFGKILYLTQRHRAVIDLFKNIVKKFETTIKFVDFTLNFHWHTLVILDRQMTIIDQDKITKIWTETYERVFKKAGIYNSNKTKDNVLNVDFEPVDYSNLANELTAYVAKDLVGSFAKKDLIKEFKNKKAKFSKNKYKVDLYQANIDVLQDMEQIDITKVFIKLHKVLFAKKPFVINGIMLKSWINEFENSDNREYYNQFSFVEYAKGKWTNKDYLINRIDNEKEYLHYAFKKYCTSILWVKTNNFDSADYYEVHEKFDKWVSKLPFNNQLAYDLKDNLINSILTIDNKQI